MAPGEEMLDSRGDTKERGSGRPQGHLPCRSPPRAMAPGYVAGPSGGAQPEASAPWHLGPTSKARVQAGLGEHRRPSVTPRVPGVDLS